MNQEPDESSLAGRLLCGAIAVCLLGYGIFGLAAGDLYLPGKRGGVHLQGVPAVIMFIGMACVSALLFGQACGWIRLGAKLRVIAKRTHRERVVFTLVATLVVIVVIAMVVIWWPYFP